MLTLKQINEASFRKSSFSGYKPEDVDDFIDQVSEAFSAMAKENQAFKSKAAELTAKNAEMREKLTVLAERIESYRDEEDGIKNALLSAQKLGSASIKEAKAKAEAIMAEANARADEMVEEAKKKTTAVIESYEIKIAEKKREYEATKEAVTEFRNSLFDMYRKHLGVIESIPDFSNEISEKKVQEVEAKVQQQEEEPQPQDYRDSQVVPQAVAEIEEIEEPEEDDFSQFEDEPQEEFEDYEEFAPETVTKESFDEIDFNAYSDIPDVLKKDKASLFSTLEFGDDIDVKRKR